METDRPDVKTFDLNDDYTIFYIPDERTRWIQTSVTVDLDACR